MQEKQLKKNKSSFIEINNSFVDPIKIIKSVGVKAGDNVADFGCGPGYFSIPIAEVIGEEGEVYAFDVLPSALEALKSQSTIRGIDNIKTRRVNLEKQQSSKLGDESVDWVILKNILFQNKKKKAILKEAYRILRKKGKILVMEWNENLSLGPSQEMRIDRQKLIEIIDSENFILEKQLIAGNYHYIVVAVKL